MSIPKATEVHFFGPDVRVETFAPVFIENEGVGMVNNGGKTVIDQIAGEGKT